MPQLLDRDGFPIEYKKDEYESVGFNSDLADEVLEVIRAFPENHDQGAWFRPGPYNDDDGFKCEAQRQEDFIEDPIKAAWSCGTGLCFAGWAVSLAVGLDFEDRRFNWSDPAVVGGVDWSQSGAYSASDIGEAARQLLGITGREARELFDMGNSLGDLTKKVERLKEKYAREGEL